MAVLLSFAVRTRSSMSDRSSPRSNAGGLARANRAGEPADVILVPEQQEHAHLVTRRFRGGVLRRSDLERRVVVFSLAAVGRDELEGLDRLRDAVLGHLEVGGAQRRDGF